MRKNLRSTMAAMALALVASASPAIAATLEQIVDKHVLTIERLTSSTRTKMVRVCETTVLKVDRLDDRGAANDRITRQGDAGLLQIDRLQAGVTRTVDARTTKLVTQLQRRQASQELIDRVMQADAAADEHLMESATETKAPITAAVETATTN